MNLYTDCKSCKKEVRIKSYAVTRPDLQMEKGDDFNINCKNCGTFEKKHVNDIKAKPNNFVILIGIVIGIVVTFFLWTIFGAIGTIGAVIPILFWQQEMKATKSFNSYTIKRK
ncbi:hypothetical protein [Wenyingzhuangia sp. 2_MG-2023]|uniref:hypothetical protein n=1 Tax=Wenyingzhuangia sp. 2_MG-2023 TaxID=3062639 RepID=UPI0026E23844|nr:hypothetical protein [Wenyingzhuangia sp. 2_MG-2023]MDO6738968.1 hypothetical protein [Wenyingzhuangia sp. 2_MG-2023]MDO6803723.1 hypothetical protein [Wenyingzhuangia sp. 1_MG-2023]